MGRGGLGSSRSWLHIKGLHRFFRSRFHRLYLPRKHMELKADGARGDSGGWEAAPSSLVLAHLFGEERKGLVVLRVLLAEHLRLGVHALLRRLDPQELLVLVDRRKVRLDLRPRLPSVDEAVVAEVDVVQKRVGGWLKTNSSWRSATTGRFIDGSPVLGNSARWCFSSSGASGPSRKNTRMLTSNSPHPSSLTWNGAVSITRVGLLKEGCSWKITRSTSGVRSSLLAPPQVDVPAVRLIFPRALPLPECN